MANFIPEIIDDAQWQPLTPQRDYAVLCNPGEDVSFRFGQRHGMYISLAPSTAGRIVNSIDYEKGDATLIGNVPADTKVTIGRTSDCAIKVMHAIISRQHLEMTLKGNVLIVRDLGSTNKSFIYSQIKHFDIENYLESHPLDKAQDSTIDWVHEAFGPTIDDFLKNYSQNKGS